MKEELCAAFCGDLMVRQVGAGLAVSTAFDGPDGDPIGFYIVGPDEQGLYRLEDSGAIVPFIEASGVSLNTETRRDVFFDLLKTHNALFDEESGELVTESLAKQDLPHAALRFVALLVRVQDMLFMAHERVASTFREDVFRDISEVVGNRAEIEQNQPISDVVKDWPADFLIRPKGRDPVALFLGTSDMKVLEAIALHSEAVYQHNIKCSVVALAERENSISQKMLNRARNRLDAIPYYRGEEVDSIRRISKVALGSEVLH